MSEERFEHPELVHEYLRSLQDQIDRTQVRNERLQTRITQLEAERGELLSRLPRRKRGRPRPTSPAPPRNRDLNVPGVGVIPDIELPSGPVARPDMRVAAVLDEFSRSAYQYEFDLIDIPAKGWEESLESSRVDLLLVESAYSGYRGQWAAQIARFGRPSALLTEVVDWCRKRSIPTVFWVKEDPINHDWFLASASLFDIVLTVDSNMVDSYRRRLDVRNVEVLQFGAQPAIHFPPASGDRPGRVAFAGSYYAAKHPERQQQMEMLLKPAMEAGLQIFDRMDRPEDRRFAWPDEYLGHIVGSLTYAQTLEAYRRYLTFINVNTVVDSPTMCARRVYELLASGTRVVSGPARALQGVPVEIADTEDDVKRILNDGDAFDASAGFDWVNDGNLLSHRVDSILDFCP